MSQQDRLTIKTFLGGRLSSYQVNRIIEIYYALFKKKVERNTISQVWNGYRKSGYLDACFLQLANEQRTQLMEFRQ